MIKDLSDLREFIVWAKSQKLQSVNLGSCSFTFSELAHIESYPDMTAQPETKDLSRPAQSPKLPDGNAETPEDEALLYWSTR